MDMVEVQSKQSKKVPYLEVFREEMRKMMAEEGFSPPGSKFFRTPDPEESGEAAAMLRNISKESVARKETGEKRGRDHSPVPVPGS